MNEWQSAYNELKRRYLVQSQERLDQVAALIEKINVEPNDQVLGKIKHHFHWLAGSGGIYGLPELTNLGKDAEEFCEGVQVFDANSPARELTDFVRAARELFSANSDRKNPAIAVKADERRLLEILLVDKDQSRADKFKELFEELSIKVQISEAFDSGLSAMQQQAFDGLIVTMPVAGGSAYDLVEQFRNTAPGGNQPALILNSQPGFLDKVQAIHCGADGFFDDPFVLQDVAERMRFLLEAPEAPDYRILYVEDDPYQAEFVRAILSSAGYAIEICSDARNFDSLLTSHQPDLVLLDIMMPDITGYELARYLRQSETYATLPILFLTTEAKIDAKIRAAKAGGDDYLVKPVAPSLLLSTVAAKLERARFLKSLLHRDGLTKLFTHSAFMNLAQMVLARKMRQPEKSVGLIIIDIDRFKSVNDTYGHPVGDRVITSLANLLRRRIRRSDLVGRYGGEEFVVIVEDLTEAEVQSLAERLLSDFSQIQHKADATTFSSTFSAGMAMLDATKLDLGEWINIADAALLNAKQTGRNKIVKGPVSSIKS